jgi:hypothetical protein
VGASVWSARVPYQEPLEVALRQAREDAYARGDFYRDPQNSEALAMSENEFVARQLAAAQAEIDTEFGEDSWELDDTDFRDTWRAARVEVTGPDTLLAAQPHSGTHSVIDMTGVANTPADGMVAPVPTGILYEVFDTRQPTRSAVEQALDADKIPDFGRDRGAYVVAYEDGVPTYVYFFGHSGD